MRFSSYESRWEGDIAMRPVHSDIQTLRLHGPTKNPFASLVRSIVYQQLSAKAAASIERKFFCLYNPDTMNAPAKRGTLRGRKFPKPKDILKTPAEKLRTVGLSRSKITYLKDLAEKFENRTINPKKFSTMRDEDIIDHLTQVKGIGVWSAHMFLIFALNRPDVLPVGDLAIRKGFMKAFGLRKMPTPARMHMLARPHSGRRTYLALHLWKVVDGGDFGW